MLMLRSMETLYGFTVMAVDGDVGRLDDVLFDDEEWSVRYLSVISTAWPSGKVASISTEAVGAPDWNEMTLPVDLTTEAIENSPQADVDEPFSRQHEIRLHDYYGWAPYWPSSSDQEPEVPDSDVNLLEEDTVESEVWDQNYSHLQATRELQGYRAQLNDGTMGVLQDFIVDSKEWIIRYLIFDLSDCQPGKRGIVPIELVDDISSGEEKIYLDMTKEDLCNSPDFNPKEPVNRTTESKIYDFYGQARYWE